MNKAKLRQTDDQPVEVKEPVPLKEPEPSQLKELSKLLEKGQTALVLTVNEDGYITIADLQAVKNYDFPVESKEHRNLAVMTYGLQWMGFQRNLGTYGNSIRDAFTEYDTFNMKEAEKLIEDSGKQITKESNRVLHKSRA